MRLGFTSYNTIYSTKSPNPKVPNLEEYSRACFADSMRDLSNCGIVANSYHIKLFLQPINKTQSTMHYVFITKEQMIKWFEELQFLYPFEYVFSEETKDSCYLDIHIIGRRPQHLFVLTGIRYIYEVWQNISLLLALTAKEQIKDLQKVSLLNLTSVSIIALQSLDIYVNTGHTLTGIKTVWDYRAGKSIYYPYLINRDSAKQRLSEINDNNTRVFDTVCPKYDLLADTLEIHEEVKELKDALIAKLGDLKAIYDSTFWEDKENLDLFMPTILKIYNKLNSYSEI